MTPAEALEIEFNSEIGIGTIRAYLTRLLVGLWQEGCRRGF